MGYHVSDQTVGNIVKEHGIEPAPDRERQTTWKTFVKSHWDVLASIDLQLKYLTVPVPVTNATQHVRNEPHQ